MPQEKTAPEFWLSGPVPGITPLLQPVAHALLQARREVNEMMEGFPDAWLWEKPAGLASPAFHLQHMAGVMDRLLTYCRGDMLDDAQLIYLRAEGKASESITLASLLENMGKAVDLALRQLTNTEESTLTTFRGVGRAQLPSNVIGLLVHMAEHTMRHTGQLLVTAGVIRHSKL